MLNANLREEAESLREELREAHEELRSLPLGGRGHLADLQLDASRMLGLLLEHAREADG